MNKPMKKGKSDSSFEYMCKLGKSWLPDVPPEVPFCREHKTLAIPNRDRAVATIDASS